MCDEQLLSAVALTVRKVEPGGRALELRFRLGQADLIRSRIDSEEEVTAVNDVAVLEIDPGERPAYLAPQLNALDRGKLAEKAPSGVECAHERPAREHLRQGCWAVRGDRLSL